MNADVVLAAVGAAAAVGVPIGAGLIKMYGRLVKVDTQLTIVHGQLNGHLKYHEKISRSFIATLKEDNEFDEERDS